MKGQRQGRSVSWLRTPGVGAVPLEPPRPLISNYRSIQILHIKQ